MVKVQLPNPSYLLLQEGDKRKGMRMKLRATFIKHELNEAKIGWVEYSISFLLKDCDSFDFHGL